MEKDSASTAFPSFFRVIVDDTDCSLLVFFFSPATCGFLSILIRAFFFPCTVICGLLIPLIQTDWLRVSRFLLDREQLCALSPKPVESASLCTLLQFFEGIVSPAA